MNILLGVTGSVAATLTRKMVAALQELGEVRVVLTKAGEYFLSPDHDSQYLMAAEIGAPVFRDKDEWEGPNGKIWQKNGDPVVHIGLRKWAGVLVVAPLSDNTLTKMSVGLCDNLLTCVYRAWDNTRPVVVAPAMNTLMWENDLTQEHIGRLKTRGVHVVDPVSKLLACGDDGNGAMAHVNVVKAAVAGALRWHWPLASGGIRPKDAFIPESEHPGGFGFHRKHDVHTGVDLYTVKNAPVYAMESGRVIRHAPFTGEQVGMPWWNNTDALLVEGPSGVVCYGEIELAPEIRHGSKAVVARGDLLGRVVPVLPESKARPDIQGHSCSMLHIELYRRGYAGDWAAWSNDGPRPDDLLDPTALLKDTW
jgi:3-polyprenyl-4-hydroxybenzoate decarboxylase